MRRFLNALVGAFLALAPAIAMAQVASDALILFGGQPKPVLDLNFAAMSALPASVTFTRATTATYVNSAGLIATASSGTPRFTFDPVTLAPLGYLSEEADSNLAIQSNGFLTGWTATNSTPTAAATTSPDGTADGWSWQRSSTASAFIGRAASKAASALTYTGSIFAKISNCNFVALRMQGTFPARVDVVFNLATGTISSAATATTFTGPSATITPAGNGWYRLSVTGTSDTAVTINLSFSASTNGVVIDGTDSSGSSAAFFYQADLVQSSTLTSPIPTTVATVTRNADVASINSISSVGIPAAPSALSFAAKFTSPVNFDATKVYYIFQLDDTTTNNRSLLRFTATAGDSLQLINLIATVVQFTLNLNSAPAANTLIRAWGAIAPAATSVQALGQAKVLNTAATPLPSGQTRLQIGNANGAALNSTIARLQFFNKRISDNQMAAIAAGM